ncbi:alpha/beta hydrolase [Maribacter sp. 1_2014MBL_MicDiv]|uniref:alpha/beta hydrolase n=1 Tax=Maribacter sp. 1_2014MBL_MicDiv TaxID=1644130 RepID=UPI0009F3DECD|nr:alpha/beta fold hydrolase [Maribacter sp. 1_2014MBL_MicDiv]
MKTIFSFVLSLSSICMFAQKTIDFPSKDGLLITADYYKDKGSETFILLFHQAGWSRGEYKEIAPKLNTLGYNCLAIDQRSGGAVNSVTNQTNQRAVAAGKETTYLDAYQDIEATVAYVKKAYSPKKIIIWGSSYSSSLVLKYAGDHPDQIDAAMAFSPGEYFGKDDFIKNSAAHIKVPTFITSAQNEQDNWAAINQAIPTTTKVTYVPATAGNHGSRALWEKFEDNNGYWNAVKNFLKQL